MTARQLALDCDPTWLDPEPDDEEDDEPWCYHPDLDRQGANPYRLAHLTTIKTNGNYL